LLLVLIFIVSVTLNGLYSLFQKGVCHILGNLRGHGAIQINL